MFAHSFKLLGLLLSLCIFASATPMHIDIVTSSPAGLERRVTQGEKNRCPWPSVWRRRECTPTVSVRDWRDVCDYRANPPLFHYPRGSCPPNHLCVPDVDGDGDETIRCVPQQPKKDNSSDGSPARKKQKTHGYFSGTSSLVTAAPGPQNTEEDWLSMIDFDIDNASVSAEFVSSDTSFGVAPNSVIVGKIKGTNIIVCEGDKSDPNKARICYPKGRHDLKKGQGINFTYGLTHGQSGYLHWAVIPMVHDELR